jgi:CPA2 family monovalent cation:H+ antiporter-2
VLGGEPPAGQAPGNLGLTLAVTLGKVALFVGLMLIVGARVFPWILRRVVRTQSRELFTLAAIALALGVAFGSAKLFDVSVALGAFFAGMVISRSETRQQTETYLQPLQDTFAALFFVAVGMLFKPSVLLEHPLEVLEVLAIIVIGKSLAALLIVRLLGRSLDTALSVAAALAQIGEFSFILAVMGITLKVLPPQAQQYIVAGALLSIMLNPLVFAILGRLRAPAPPAAGGTRTT